MKKRSVIIRSAVPSFHTHGKKNGRSIVIYFFLMPSDLLAFIYLKSLMMSKTQLRGSIMERLRTECLGSSFGSTSYWLYMFMNMLFSLSVAQCPHK